MNTITSYKLNPYNVHFEVPFAYLSKNYVNVSVRGEAGVKKLSLITDFRFLDYNTIETTRPFGSIGYSIIEIRRNTPADRKLINFTDGSVLTADELNASTTQALHVAEEGRDLTGYSLELTPEGQLDAKGRSIINLGDADTLDPMQAVNVKTVKDLLEINATAPNLAVPSIASLRLIEPKVEQQLLMVSGYYEGSSVGGGYFYYDHTDRETEDDSGLTFVTRGGARWKRLLDAKGPLLLTMFGAKEGLENDNTSVISKFFDKMKDIKGTYVIPEGVYAWKGKVFLPSNITLQIDGTLAAFDKTGFRIETYDGITSTPAYTGTHDIIITGKGVLDERADVFDSSWQTPLRIHHSKNVLVENITIKNISSYHGIESGGTDGLTIRNVTFINEFKANTLELSNLNLEYIQIEHISSEGTSGAIPYDDTPCKNVLIENCTFKATDGNQIYSCIGEHGESPNRLKFENIYIRNNMFIGINSTEVKSHSVINFTSHYTNLVIEGNVFKDCKGNCVRHTGTLINSKIVNNDFLNTTRKSGTVNYATIDLNTVNTLDIHYNRVQGSDYGFLSSKGNINGLSVTDNSLLDMARINKLQSSDIIPYIMLSGSGAYKGKNVLITRNIFQSQEDHVMRPIHIPNSSLANYNNTRIYGNVYNFKKVDADNVNRYLKLNECVLYRGAIYYGLITLSDDLRKYSKLLVTYEIGGNVLIKVVDPTAKNVSIKELNVPDSNRGPFSFLYEANCTRKSDNTINIDKNIRVEGNTTWSEKTDNISSDGYIKITKIVGLTDNVYLPYLEA